MCFTIFVLQSFAQHENEVLLVLSVNRNYSFFMVMGMSPVNITVVPAFPFDRL